MNDGTALEEMQILSTGAISGSTQLSEIEGSHGKPSLAVLLHFDILGSPDTPWCSSTGNVGVLLSSDHAWPAAHK